MKKGLLLLTAALMLFAAGCSSSSAPSNLSLESKHKAFPDYVLKASPTVQETYKMAASDPDALKAVPCYCGCYQDAGHLNNLDCFVKQMGPNKEVQEWDPMGVG